MNIFRSGALLLILSVMAGCAGARTVTSAPGIPGEREFRANCVSCHSLPDPKERTDKQWSQIIESHGAMIGLGQDVQKAILQYVQEHNPE